MLTRPTTVGTTLARSLVTLATAGVAGLGVLGAVTTAAHAAPADHGTTVRPDQLTRGPAPTVPFVVGHTIVDRDTRVPVVAGADDSVRLLGASGNGYVVLVHDVDGDRRVVERVAPGTPARHLVRLDTAQDAVLSDDGRRLVVTDVGRRRSTFEVRSATTGDVGTTRTFRGTSDVLDVQGRRVLLGGYGAGASTWDLVTGAVHRVTDRAAYAGDLSDDRLALFTKDPHRGGCSVVTSISRPAQRLWRSCDERVQSFSPGGGQMLTAGILADGIGPREMWQRTVDGTEVAHLNVGAYFGYVAWEGGSTYVVDAYGTERGATVRCSGTDCERVSAVRPTTY